MLGRVTWDGIEAAREVNENWEAGDLAGAVNVLSAWVEDAELAVQQCGISQDRTATAPVSAPIPVLDMSKMRCQEASQFSFTKYMPCYHPATKLVLSERGRRLYPMCEMCADHNIRNRGAKLAAVHEAMNV